MYQYRAKVVEWKDGDTVVIDVDLGFSVTVRQTVRVNGINCPEIHSKDATEKARGLAALYGARSLAPVGTTVTVISSKPGGGDKYGRYLATIQLGDSRDYAATMVAGGHARLWDGQGERP